MKINTALLFYHTVYLRTIFSFPEKSERVMKALLQMEKKIDYQGKNKKGTVAFCNSPLTASAS
ncbi:MAG: hypothetical protein QHH06_06260 [Clostridiales bacterium]|nr:hypothetical protein [Eubacteriales bacterium]MDH7566067.1 hypothetical protein [Clostridiales bacterium]